MKESIKLSEGNNLLFTGLPLSRQYEIPWLLPDFFRPRLSSTMIPRPFRGVWGHAPTENFQNLDLQLGGKQISYDKILWLFPDVWNSVANSLTFRGLFQISWLFQVFQVSGNPVFSFSSTTICITNFNSLFYVKWSSYKISHSLMAFNVIRINLDSIHKLLLFLTYNKCTEHWYGSLRTWLHYKKLKFER